MDNLIQTFITLCSIPSPSGKEEEIQKHLVTEFKGLVDSIFVDQAGNLYCHKQGYGRPLLYCAHMDTVEPAGLQQPVIEGGIIKSNGKYVLGADDKASVAAILDMLKTLLAKKLSHRDIEVLITVREETDAGMKEFPKEKINSKIALLADISRPIGSIITAAPYVCGYSVEVSAPGCHVALISKDTIHPLHFLEAFKKSVPFGRISENTIVNIAKIRMGESYNSVPQSLQFTGEIRTFETEYYHYFLDKLSKSVQELDSQYGTSSKLTIYPYCSGYMLTEKDITLAKKAMNNVSVVPAPIKAFSVGDFNILYEWGIKPLNIGTGALEVHTTRERISIESLVKLRDIFVEAALAYSEA